MWLLAFSVGRMFLNGLCGALWKWIGHRCSLILFNSRDFNLLLRTCSPSVYVRITYLDNFLGFKGTKHMNKHVPFLCFYLLVMISVACLKSLVLTCLGKWKLRCHSLFSNKQHLSTDDGFINLFCSSVRQVKNYQQWNVRVCILFSRL